MEKPWRKLQGFSKVNEMGFEAARRPGELREKRRSGRDTDKFEGVHYKIGETGAPCRSERVAKYNRLLAIEEELG